jgi:outer membrane protein OmpA-like peptidoglycan-associated protein
MLLFYPLLLMLMAPLARAQHSLVNGQQRRQDTLVLHFAFDRFAIAPDYDSALWHQYFNSPDSKLKQTDSAYIIGYTDTVGTVEYNKKLSSMRAVASYNWLIKELANIARHPPRSDIPGISITAGGKAHTLLYSDSANRRAEIVIYYHLETTSAIAPPSPVTLPATPPADSLAVIQQTDTPRAVIKLQKINFVVDTPIPTAATRTVLPGIVRLLQQYKDRRMEIDGYVNSFTPLHGKNDPLFILSVDRAKFIYDYLIGAGFDPTKLSYKGMGNASPVNPNPTSKAEMNANMRVEIKVY